MTKTIKLIDLNYTIELIMHIESVEDTDFQAAFKKLSEEEWQFLPVKQQRGRCYFNSKTITIPEHAYKSKKPGYLTYYIAHEMAHAIGLHTNHDGAFMRTLLKICPIDCLHHETEYKPRNAKAAGISSLSSLSSLSS